MKSTIVDRIEDVEPPLAHMIPELSSNLLLPLVVVIAMFAIDWRMGLALLVTIPVALIPMTFGMRTYNKNYAAYMEANCPCEQRDRGICRGHSGGESVQPGGAVLSEIRPSGGLLPGLHHGMVPLHLGFHESVPVHSADHPAGDPAGGRRALSGGDTGPGPGDALPDAGPGNRVPPDERHRLHQLHEKYAVCSKGHP